MLEKINKIFTTPKWLFVLLAVVFVFRIPTLFEPYSYGDELIYLALGEGIRQGIPLYSGIHDNKPPLLYIMAAVSGNLFWFKAILTIWSMITIYIFWKLTRVIFPKSEKSQIVATIVFSLLTTIPLLEGHIANAELFMIGPTILAFYFLLSGSLTSKKLLTAGFLFSVSSLFKIPAVFDIPAVFVYWLVMEKNLNLKSITKITKNATILLVGFLTPILLSFIWFAVQGSFGDYFSAAYLQNVGYLSSWRPDDMQKPFLVKNGPLIIRALIVAIAALFLFVKRNKISKKFVFVTAWLFFSLFGVTLSERPYPHYLIQAVPAISFLISVLVTSKTKEQVFAIIPLLFASFIPFYYDYYHYETLSYYQRFVKLSTGQMAKNDYLESFGSHVPTNYEVSNFLVSSTSKDDKIYVHGDGTAIYALTKRLPPLRFVADYHIKDFSSNQEVIRTLENNMPAYIVVQPTAPTFADLENLLSKNYGLIENFEGVEVYKLLSPEVRSLFTD